jgi:hypothetical protein
VRVSAAGSDIVVSFKVVSLLYPVIFGWPLKPDGHGGFFKLSPG